MRKALALAIIAFAVTIPLLTGARLSDEILAVLVGAAFGIAATLPASLGLWIALTRHWNEEEAGCVGEPRLLSIPPPAPPRSMMTPPMPWYVSTGPGYFSNPYSDSTPGNFASSATNRQRGNIAHAVQQKGKTKMVT